MAQSVASTSAGKGSYDLEAGTTSNVRAESQSRRHLCPGFCVILTLLVGSSTATYVLRPAAVEQSMRRLAKSLDVFRNRGRYSTAFTSYMDEHGSCHVYGGPNQYGELKGDDQAFFTLSNSGTAYGVTGSCSVAAIEDWAKYNESNCDREAIKTQGPWAFVWQGATSVSADGFNIENFKMQVTLPGMPQAQSTNFSYSIWFNGVQPALQPSIPPKGNMCDLEGKDSTIVYNSGQFSRVMWRSRNSAWFRFNESLFNPPESNWNNKYLFTSNILLGKSSLGPTFGYAGAAHEGQTLWFDGQLGHLSGKSMAGEEMPSNLAGWKNAIGVNGTDTRVVFAFNNTVYEDVFLKPAIKAGTIDNMSSPQAKLITGNNWSWAVGPPYEWTIIEEKPDLTDIPLLWPSDPVYYNDLEMQVSEGGDWAPAPGDGSPWVLRFDQGLEVTGTAFEGTLWTDYGALNSSIKANYTANKEVVCLWACINSRKRGSSCDIQKSSPGYVKANCTLKFAEPFPPPECTTQHWQKF